MEQYLMNLRESTLIWPSVSAKCARIWWVLPVNGSAKSREKLWSEDVKVANTVKPWPGMSEDTFVSSFSLQTCTDFYTEVATKHWQTMTKSAPPFPHVKATSVCGHPIGPIGHTRPAYTILRNHLPTFWSRGRFHPRLSSLSYCWSTLWAIS